MRQVRIIFVVFAVIMSYVCEREKNKKITYFCLS